MQLSEFIGFFLIVIIASLAAAAGIGGGVIIVPVSLLFFNLSGKQAAALSNLLILVNAFFKYVFGMQSKDPLKKNKTLIDYSLVLIFNPILLFANVIGSIINKMIPDGLLLTVLAVLLVATIILNIRNGIRLWKQEKKIINKNQAIENSEQQQINDPPNFVNKDNDNEVIPPDFNSQQFQTNPE